jgi:hypothetical protein
MDSSHVIRPAVIGEHAGERGATLHPKTWSIPDDAFMVAGAVVGALEMTSKVKEIIDRLPASGDRPRSPVVISRCRPVSVEHRSMSESDTVMGVDTPGHDPDLLSIQEDFVFRELGQTVPVAIDEDEANLWLVHDCSLRRSIVASKTLRTFMWVASSLYVPTEQPASV